MKYSQIFDMVNIGLVVLDKDLKVQKWNRWMALHSEVPTDKIIGSSIFDFYPHLETPSFLRNCKSVLKFGNFSFFSQKLHKYFFPFKPENVGVDLDFEYMQQNCAMGPIRDEENGSIEHLFITVQDVTEIVAYQRKLLDKSVKHSLTGVFDRRYFPFLLSLPDEVCKALIEKSLSRDFSKGDVVMPQDIRASSLHIVKKGSVEIIHTGINDEETVLGERSRGDCFGEMSLLTGEGTSTGVRCKTDSTILLLNKEDFFNLMETYPKFSMYFNQLLTDRLLTSNSRVRKILDEGMIGHLEIFPIYDLIQNLLRAQSTGMLELRRGDDTALLVFTHGQVDYAKTKNKSGENAVYELCEWKKGHFIFRHSERKFAKNVSNDTMHLLMEAMKQVDEGGR